MARSGRTTTGSIALGMKRVGRRRRGARRRQPDLRGGPALSVRAPARAVVRLHSRPALSLDAGPVPGLVQPAGVGRGERIHAAPGAARPRSRRAGGMVRLRPLLPTVAESSQRAQAARGGPARSTSTSCAKGITRAGRGQSTTAAAGSRCREADTRGSLTAPDQARAPGLGRGLLDAADVQERALGHVVPAGRPGSRARRAPSRDRHVLAGQAGEASATNIGCDRKRSRRRARKTVILSSSDNSSMPRMATISCSSRLRCSTRCASRATS